MGNATEKATLTWGEKKEIVGTFIDGVTTDLFLFVHMTDLVS